MLTSDVGKFCAGGKKFPQIKQADNASPSFLQNTRFEQEPVYRGVFPGHEQQMRSMGFESLASVPDFLVYQSQSLHKYPAITRNGEKIFADAFLDLKSDLSPAQHHLTFLLQRLPAKSAQSPAINIPPILFSSLSQPIPITPEMISPPYYPAPSAAFTCSHGPMGLCVLKSNSDPEDTTTCDLLPEHALPTLVSSVDIHWTDNRLSRYRNRKAPIPNAKTQEKISTICVIASFKYFLCVY
eukprot:c2823_g1_i3.p1 GENE.c2823_g1_i3~~c2823_g1_i3.p1  ORF type:complete len:240 (-),score=6.97 c2823_g1_i3:446-1165(-)